MSKITNKMKVIVVNYEGTVYLQLKIWSIVELVFVDMGFARWVVRETESDIYRIKLCIRTWAKQTCLCTFPVKPLSDMLVSSRTVSFKKVIFARLAAATWNFVCRLHISSCTYVHTRCLNFEFSKAWKPRLLNVLLVTARSFISGCQERAALQGKLGFGRQIWKI